MALASLCFITTFFALVHLTPLVFLEEEYQFKQWMSQYNNIHDNEEYYRRLRIFTENKRKIDHHNAGNHSYTMGLNQFSDMTFEEFRKSFLLTEPQNCSATNGAHRGRAGPHPESLDWREKGNVVTPVKNQGPCGSCWTFSATGCLESVNAIASGKLISLSEQQLVDCAQDFNNHGCMGMMKRPWLILWPGSTLCPLPLRSLLILCTTEKVFTPAPSVRTQRICRNRVPEMKCQSNCKAVHWLLTTRRTKRKIPVEMSPAGVEGAVRQSARNALPPRRLRPSPERKDVTPPKKGKSTTRSDRGGLSPYELERLENIRQNRAFLSSINLLQATEELKQLTRPKPSQRGLLRAKAAAKEALPARKSLRLQNKEPNTSTLPGQRRLDMPTLKSLKKPPGPLPMDPINMEEGSKLPSSLLELCSEGYPEESRVDLDLNDYRSALEDMRITEDRVAKVVKDRIYSASFHPCTSSLLVAAGDKLGNVGLWKLGGEGVGDGVLLFEPHTRPVSCVAFSRAHPTQLLSLSYDGSVRCMDVEKAVFHDVYDVEGGLRTFDFMSRDCSTLVVGTSCGEVAVVDRRTPGNTHESLHSLDKSVRCVSVHPLQKHYFAVAESRGVNIYDSRCLKNSQTPAVSQLHGPSLSISSAYFSPCTGHGLLTTCMDDMIRIYDTSSMTAKPPLLTSIRHNAQSSQSRLKALSAVWDPKREDCFVVSSSQPRSVMVFHQSGQLQRHFVENFNRVLSVTAFHPSRNALLGGNASGRMHVFSDQDAKQCCDQDL
ncbi:WD repeat-containing protein 76 [Spinachia spinachia]